MLYEVNELEKEFKENTSKKRRLNECRQQGVEARNSAMNYHMDHTYAGLLDCDNVVDVVELEIGTNNTGFVNRPSTVAANTQTSECITPGKNKSY